MKDKILAELKELLNDPQTGLKDSSDTNKTRSSILALLDKVEGEVKGEMVGIIETKRVEFRVTDKGDKVPKEVTNIIDYVLDDLITNLTKERKDK